MNKERNMLKIGRKTYDYDGLYNLRDMDSDDPFLIYIHYSCYNDEYLFILITNNYHNFSAINSYFVHIPVCC